ncbi:mo25-like protein 2 [Stylonychia lemnae]|uniref:Mo25-like protein 2 n=1 Tax=Stylonychia lemnae TaxID=5949 RepID=A0A078AP61_STYLE|nr:mo25-like protein 2 [Stylonychia lemnae]|eukprot:CDW83107.1 mo25-like protein 2 [Stylonychia lemnae]
MKKNQTHFGKVKKTAEQNMNCFIVSSCSYLKCKQSIGKQAASDSKYGKKFNKYLQRISQVMDGTCKKISNTPENLYKMAAELNNLVEQVAFVLINVDQFELEDRKTIQSIFTELNNNFPDIIEAALYPRRTDIVHSLISKYTQAGMAVFKLIDSMSNIETIKKLSQLVTTADFNISSDSFETFKELFLQKREGDEGFVKFLHENQEEILQVFDYLEQDENYFAKREGLKTLYQLLKLHQKIREYYVASKDRLKIIMNTVINENKGIQYEAFLLLSLFLLVNQQADSESTVILIKNRDMLFKFIGEFQPERGNTYSVEFIHFR